MLFGGWGGDAAAAADRLAAAYDVLSASGIGRLLGLRAPTVPVRVRSSPEVLTLDVTVDAAALFGGLRDATSGTVDTLLGGSGAPAKGRSH